MFFSIPILIYQFVYLAMFYFKIILFDIFLNICRGIIHYVITKILFLFSKYFILSRLIESILRLISCLEISFLWNFRYNFVYNNVLFCSYQFLFSYVNCKILSCFTSIAHNNFSVHISKPYILLHVFYFYFQFTFFLLFNF